MFIGCDSTLAIVALCVISALNAGKYAGQMMSAHDMSPNYAGSLAGMTVTLGNASGFLSPIVTGVLTNEQVNWHLSRDDNLSNSNQIFFT